MEIRELFFRFVFVLLGVLPLAASDAVVARPSATSQVDEKSRAAAFAALLHPPSLFADPDHYRACREGLQEGLQLLLYAHLPKPLADLIIRYVDSEEDVYLTLPKSCYTLRSIQVHDRIPERGLKGHWVLNPVFWMNIPLYRSVLLDDSYRYCRLADLYRKESELYESLKEGVAARLVPAHSGICNSEKRETLFVCFHDGLAKLYNNSHFSLEAVTDDESALFGAFLIQGAKRCSVPWKIGFTHTAHTDGLSECSPQTYGGDNEDEFLLWTTLPSLLRVLNVQHLVQPGDRIYWLARESSTAYASTFAALYSSHYHTVTQFDVHLKPVQQQAVADVQQEITDIIERKEQIIVRFPQWERPNFLIEKASPPPPSSPK